MEQIIWIELISQQGQVLSRTRFNKSTVNIGRSYKNDIILDDPFVAPEHLLIESDREGNISARDLKTLNGFTINKIKERQDFAQLDDSKLIRIGQSYLRVRTNTFSVAAERALPLQDMKWYELPIILVLPILVSCLKVWLDTTDHLKWSAIILSALSAVGFMLFWGGIWAIISRIFSGNANWGRYLRISGLLFIGMILMGTLDTYVSYAFSTALLFKYMNILYCVIFGYFIFECLQVIGKSKVVLKAAIVSGLTLLTITISSIAFMDPQIFSRYDFSPTILPVAFRLTSAQSADEFFATANHLKADLDEERQEDPPADYVAKWDR